MTEPDWIVLRLLRQIVKGKTVYGYDAPRAMLYLLRKYGEKTVDQCVDLLINEEKIK